MKFLAKRLLLSALGAFVLATAASAQDPKVMPKADGKAPAAQPAPVIVKYEDCNDPCGKSNKGCKSEPSCKVVEPTCTVIKEACDTGCKDNGCGRRGGLQFGVGLYYIKPFWESNTSLTTTTQTLTVAAGAVNATTSTGTQDFDHNYEFAPRLFAGYVSECGLGVRLGWWRFEDDASAAALLTPTPVGAPAIAITAPGIGGAIGGANSGVLAPGQAISFALSNRIEINVGDLDITQRLLDNSCWNLTIGGGVRYLKLDQSYNAAANATGLPAGVVVNAGATSRNEFDAYGPNLLIDAKRSLGDRGLGLYTLGRFGVLFGDSRQESNTRTFQAAGAASITVSNTTVTDHEDFIPFLDVEAGIQWSGCGNGTMKPFARLGATGQSYFGVGNGSGTNLNQNLGFFGLTALIGVGF